MFAAERMRNQRIDIRYLGMLGLLMFYMFLTGNRFSAFYNFGSFFVIPFSAAIAGEIRDHRSKVPFFWIGRSFRTRDLIALGAIIGLAAVVTVVGIYNNLANVRRSHDSELCPQFLQRPLLHPTHPP